MHRTTKAVAASLVIGLASGVWLAENFGNHSTVSKAAAQEAVTISNPPLLRQPLAAELTPDEQRNIQVYETANRSVVNIDTTVVEVDHFWNMRREAEGSGSGSVLDKQGHILTNFHVVDGAQQMQVTLASNTTYPAKLVGFDRQQDVAVIKIDAPPEELFPISLGSSSHLRVGQRVFAVGNPLGWDGTTTTGIISSLNRNLPSRVPDVQMQSLIQTDAAMNPGNSGGPLLNSQGHVIGMCVAIASRTGQNSGIGFAIPIDRIKAMLPDLIERGHVMRGDIGIANVMETNSGLVIGVVDPEGPAARAGLQGFRVTTQRRQQGPFVVNQRVIDRSQADRIIAVDGQPVQTGVEFRDKIWEHRPGEVVTLTILRADQQLEVPVTLGGE
jgi:S1-C subfamily serine protease